MRDMNQPSNMPGGRYGVADDRSRPGQASYGKNDDPQIVCSGVIFGQAGQPFVLFNAQNIRSVANAGLDWLVTFGRPQINALYQVYFTEEYLAALVPSHWISHTRTGLSFVISAFSEAGAQLNLGQNTRRLYFEVRRGIL